MTLQILPFFTWKYLKSWYFLFYPWPPLSFCGLGKRFEEQHYHSNSIRISAICLKLGVVMHSTMEQITIKMALLGQFLYVPQNFEIFHGMLGPGLREDVTTLTVEGSQLSAWNLVEWCTVSWSRSALKTDMLGQFLRVGWNFHNRLGPGLKEDDSY